MTDQCFRPHVALARVRMALLPAILALACTARADPAPPSVAVEGFGGAMDAAAAASPAVATAEADARPPNLPLRNTLIIGTTASLYAAYGMAKWWESGFGGGFKTVNEGWFGRDTQYGGIDKLGHLYTSYASTRLLTPLFEAVGNSRESAVALAAWTSLGIYLGIEIADGFSRSYAFSPQDAAMNVAGTLLGYVMETRPELDGMFDFRLDYRPSANSGFEPFGDYSGQRYLLVVKADAFAPLRQHSVTRYLELAVGYGARGFEPGGERRRDVYVGISLNLSRLLADAAYDGRMHSTPFQRGTDRLFDLIQFPTVGYTRRSLD
jgi:hypothetical protein